MITHLGRVVYERVQHKFTAKDIGRILYSEVKDMDPLETGFFVALVLSKILFQWLKDPATLLKFLKHLTKTLLEQVGLEELPDPEPPPSQVDPGGSGRYRP